MSDTMRLPSEIPPADEVIHDELQRLLPAASEADMIHELLTRSMRRPGRRRRHSKGEK